jgi:hypothetical protein
MGWFLLEAVFALVVAVVIVWWTMGPKRRDPGGDTNRRDGDAR